MKIIHRISLSPSREQRRKLESLGLKVDVPESPLVSCITLIVDESHAAWNELEGLIREWNALDFVTQQFTKKEFDNSRFLKLTPTWHHGYPQPEDDFDYLSVTYKTVDYCSECGIGKVQNNPFRIRREPKWGRRHVLQLNWVFDEYFVKPEIWEAVFKPFGVGKREVIKHRSSEELETVVQLDIQTFSDSKLSIPSSIVTQKCSKCHRTKYEPVTGDFFPVFEKTPDKPMFRTQEYFGSGASAWNAVIISNDVYRALQTNKIKGVDFHPVGNPFQSV